MSVEIIAKNASVDFPVFNSGHRSLRKNLLRAATGGAIARDSSDHVVVKALDNINLTINPGDKVGLVGHNGSGKSTLLRVLAGAYIPTSGELKISGSIASLLDINLGMNWEATGYENIIVRGILMGLSRKEIESKIDEIASFADIGDFLYLPMRTYSSGMSMRLGFAVSTSIDADIILMDEWLSVGDAEFNEKAKIRLNEMLDNSSIMVLASHDESLVNSVCNKKITLEKGKIISCEEV